MDFNVTIKHNLVKNGFKHSKTLKEAGVSKQTFFYWHESSPSVTALMKISEVTGLTIDELIKPIEEEQ